MAMLEKITDLKKQNSSKEVKILCDNAISVFSATIYNNVPDEAKIEIEKVALNNLFEGLFAIEDKDIQKWVNNEKRIYSVKNLGIREAINNLKNEDPGLTEILEDFRPKLEDNHEVLLYEEFITAIQSFKYFPEVGNAIEVIKNKVNSYKNDVDITKIIETMKLTRSNYLIPYIETYVQIYLNNKTEQNKSHLKEALIKFSYDPFVCDIINAVSQDSKDLQLEYSNTECDIEKIYSPLIYLGENEAVFNVKGAFYIKKGNNISRLLKNDKEKLDEKFIELCDIINLPNVEIDSKGISVYSGSDSAVITENQVIINNQEFKNEDFKEISKISKWEGNDNFFILVEAIRNNYEEISEVNFVKRVYLKENEQHSADVFKLRDNIFIATHNPNLGKSTFYRNVNPIQAKNLMMEHLNFDVSRTFKNILPQEEKINGEINETRKAFRDYIVLLEGKIETMGAQTANEVTTKVIDALKEELLEIKADYKDYLNNVEKYMRAPEDVDISDLSEDITITIDINGKKYVVPIPVDGESQNDGELAKDEEDAGTIVGRENIEDDTAASAVTFDDEEAELLGDSPSIRGDEINLDSEEIEAEAEEAEEEAEEKEEEEEDAEDFEDENEKDSEDKDEKIGDEELDKKAVKKEKKKKKKIKTESLEKSTFLNDSTETSKKLKKRVFLIKNKSI